MSVRACIHLPNNNTKLSHKLDPANHKTIIDLQNETLQQTSNSKAQKRKRPQVGSGENGEDVAEEEKLVPMPESSGIEALRRKLHDRMAELRNRGQSGEAGDRDELLEERRRQRANMRERRRKETKEKIKREEETRGKKNKEKREEKQKGHSARVRYLSVPTFGHEQPRFSDAATGV